MNLFSFMREKSTPKRFAIKRLKCHVRVFCGMPINRLEMIDKCGAALSFIKVALIYKTSRILYKLDDHLSARV